MKCFSSLAPDITSKNMHDHGLAGGVLAAGMPAKGRPGPSDLPRLRLGGKTSLLPDSFAALLTGL